MLMETTIRALITSTFQTIPVTTKTLVIVVVGARLETTLSKDRVVIHAPKTLATPKTTTTVDGETTKIKTAIDETKIAEVIEVNPNLNPTVRRAIQAMIQKDAVAVATDEAKMAAKTPEHPKDAVAKVTVRAKVQRTVNAMTEKQRLVLTAQNQKAIRRGVLIDLQFQPIGAGFPVVLQSIPSILTQESQIFVTSSVKKEIAKMGKAARTSMEKRMPVTLLRTGVAINLP